MNMEAKNVKKYADKNCKKTKVQGEIRQLDEFGIAGKMMFLNLPERQQTSVC